MMIFKKVRASSSSLITQDGQSKKEIKIRIKQAHRIYLQKGYMFKVIDMQNIQY